MRATHPCALAVASCLLLLLGIPHRLEAQTGGVSGVVTAPDGRPLPLASVDLFAEAEESADAVASTATDSIGAFSLVHASGTYRLEISFLSHATHRERVEIHSGATSSLGTIVLQPRALELEGLVVERERSQMQLTFEKRVFRVGEDITVMGGSVLDILDNVPSLTTDFNGTISLRGSSAVTVLIDGRPSSVYTNGSRALQSLPADLIAEVEVITNPSARYDAEGSAGIINIILKKETGPGFRGSVGGMQRRPEASQVTTNLNYGWTSVNAFVNASLAYANDPAHSRTRQLFQSEDTSYVYHGIDDGDETDWDGEFRIGADVDLPAQQQLTASALWHFEDKEDRWTGIYVDSTIGGVLLDRIDRRETIGGGEGEIGLALEYEKLFGDEDHTLSATAEYEGGTARELPYLVEQYPDGPLEHDVDDVRLTDAVQVNIDYLRQVGDSGKVEAGLASDLTWRDNRYTVRERRGQAGPWTELPAFDGNYSAFDALHAAYATVSSYVGPFTWQVGLRAEYYRVRTRLRDVADASRQSYADLFPSGFLTYHLSALRSIQFSYSSRIFRPGTSLLLPTTAYGDSRSRSTGNPALRPEHGGSWEAQFHQVWETGSALGSIYYRHRRDVIQRISRLDGQGVFRTVPINLSEADAWGVELTAGEDLSDALSVSGSANLFRTHSRGTYQGEIYRTRADRLTGRLAAEWSVAQGFRVQSALRYLGPSNTIQGHRSATTFVNLAIARDLLDGRATISLNSDDVFGTRRNVFDIRRADFVSTQRIWEPSGIRLNVTYRINPEDGEGPEED